MPFLASLLGDLGVEYLVAILVTATLTLAAVIWRGSGAPWRVRQWWEERRIRRFAPMLLEQQGAYQTHLRDVMQTFWRVRQDPPDRVRERIRREILEPIRAYIATIPGEEIKIVWFRPTEDGKELRMYEQVGHTPEGQAAMRLPVGVGFAGRAYSDGELVASPRMEHDQRFQPVERGKARGSIMCAPVRRGSETTGVLSVLSTVHYAFALADFLYLEALAASIAALETLEAKGSPSDMKNH